MTDPKQTYPKLDLAHDVEIIVTMRDNVTGHEMRIDGNLADKLLMIYAMRNRDAETIGNEK